MSRARVTAESVLSSYYWARGEESAVKLADELLSRVFVEKNRWTSPRQADFADQILAKACFDVDDLAENHLGISLHVEPLHHLDRVAGGSVYGFAKPAARAITVCERAEEYEPLYRTTVMHETAHVLLHQAPRPCQSMYAPTSRRRPAHEQEADEFMHAILLPEPILKLACAWVAHLWALDLRDGLRNADAAKGRYQWREYYFPMLMSRLCVSRHLIAVKLKHLGVFSEATLAHHLTYHLETRWREQRTYNPLHSAFRSLEDSIGRRMRTPSG